MENTTISIRDGIVTINGVKYVRTDVQTPAHKYLEHPSLSTLPFYILAEDTKATPDNINSFKSGSETYYSFAGARKKAKEEGLRIPTKEEWELIVKAINPELSISAFNKDTEVQKVLGLRLAGFYDKGKGKVVDSGQMGHYWGISINALYGYSLSFDKTTVYPMASLGHDNGRLLRLIKSKQS